MNNSPNFAKQNLVWTMFPKIAFLPLKFSLGFYSIINNFSLLTPLQKCKIILIDSNVEVDLR